MQPGMGYRDVAVALCAQRVTPNAGGFMPQ
jgi:hypothetical protein